MLMAFTNYSAVGDHLILFDWVGLENFKALFDSGSAIGKQFGSVLLWTLIWAFFATFLNFFLGTFMAIIIKDTNCGTAIVRDKMVLHKDLNLVVLRLMIIAIKVPRKKFKKVAKNAQIKVQVKTSPKVAA